MARDFLSFNATDSIFNACFIFIPVCFDKKNICAAVWMYIEANILTFLLGEGCGNSMGAKKLHCT